MTEPVTFTPTNTSARTAFVAAIVAAAAFIGFFVIPPAGMTILIASSLAGLIAIVFGIVALVKHQTKWMAVVGLVTGIVCVLVPIGLLIFALVFVGALVLS